jgi:putative ABC transport system permease protein
MPFAALIFKNLRQRPGRTAMTVAGLAVAVIAITSLWNIVWGYATSANDFFAARDVAIVVVRAGVSNRLTSSLRADLAPRLAALPGIAGVEGTLTDMVSIGDAHLIGIPLRGVAPQGFAAEQLSITRGRPLRPGDEGTVLLGSGIAEALQRPNTDRIDIEGKSFRVAGVFQAGNPFDANCIVAPIADVQKLMERPGAISEFEVRVDPSARNDTARKKLCQAIETLRDENRQPLGLKAQSTQQFIDSATEAKLGAAMAWGTSAIVLALSFVGMLNTMLMSVMERTLELGLLRAIGWKRRRIMQMILGESLVISLLGATVGLFCAWMLIRALSHSANTSLLVPRAVSGTAVFLGVAAAVIAGAVGACYPAFRAASVPPIEALRYE